MSISRLEDSRQRIRDAMMSAIGVYSAKEATEGDQWREKSIWQVTEHLAHEVKELKESEELSRKLHNAYDAIGQAAIIAARTQLEIESRNSKTVLNTLAPNRGVKGKTAFEGKHGRMGHKS